MMGAKSEYECYEVLPQSILSFRITTSSSSFILRILLYNYHAASEYTWHKHGLVGEVYSGRLISLASRYEYIPTGLK